jgi:hypothetical protein
LWTELRVSAYNPSLELPIFVLRARFTKAIPEL